MNQEGIQFQVCKNPDVKCSSNERAHRIIREKLCKFFTYKNSYRYIDVPADFVKGYNATVHSSTVMASANVTDSDVLTIWKRLQKKRSRGRVIKAKYSVGNVGIRKKRPNLLSQVNRTSALKSFGLSS